MNPSRQRGFSLVELMIAILLAAITGIVVLNVLTSYQSRSNTVSGRNDAEIAVATAMYSLEKEVRMSGAGLTTPRGPLCQAGVNISWDANPAASNGAPLLPVRIIDGGAGPDAIEIIRSDSDFGAAPTRLIANMTGPTSQISVDGRANLQDGDLVMVGGSDGSKICTLMQMSAAPAANGSGWLLSHASGGAAHFNPADPSTTFPGKAQTYAVRDNVVNMGTYGVRRFGIVCTGGGAPAATNNCDLAWWNPLDAAATPVVLAAQIVELQAQYGVAPANSTVVNQWVDATAASGWDNPSAADQQRIKAVRVAIVARGAREGNQVAPASVLLWQDDPLDVTTARVRAFTTAEQRFRYQALTSVVPLINAIWSGT
jgi:type IV pilus assembly protein PilW